MLKNLDPALVNSDSAVGAYERLALIPNAEARVSFVRGPITPVAVGADGAMTACGCNLMMFRAALYRAGG
eukprot:630968-Alexandrium_andersonii.AAC.1